MLTEHHFHLAISHFWLPNTGQWIYTFIVPAIGIIESSLSTLQLLQWRRTDERIVRPERIVRRALRNTTFHATLFISLAI